MCSFYYLFAFTLPKFFFTCFFFLSSDFHLVFWRVVFNMLLVWVFYSFFDSYTYIFIFYLRAYCFCYTVFLKNSQIFFLLCDLFVPSTYVTIGLIVILYNASFVCRFTCLSFRIISFLNCTMFPSDKYNQVLDDFYLFKLYLPTHYAYLFLSLFQLLRLVLWWL